MMARTDIPPENTWPTGFTTDWVTGFPDQPRLWAPGWRPWHWFRTRKVDLKPASWWHDLRYWAGWVVPYDISHDALAKLRPRPNVHRHEVDRIEADALLVDDFIAAGMHPLTAVNFAHRIVHDFGSTHFFWATGRKWRQLKAPIPTTTPS